MDSASKPIIIPVLLNNVKSFIIKGEKTIIFDAGRKGDSSRIIKALEENLIPIEEVSLIIISHAHTDHYGDLFKLKEISKAKVAVHICEAKYLKNGINSELITKNIALKPLLKLFSLTKVTGVEPDLLVDEKLDLKDYGVDGVIIHTPGHTKGSLSLILNDGNAIVGDLITTSKKSNHPSLPGIYSDIKSIKKSIFDVLGFKPSNIFTSHGGTYTQSDIESLVKEIVL